MSKWDERYNSKEYLYGRAPNDFLVQVHANIPMGNVLCLCEGEGRNAVFLAQQGYEVTAVDGSRVGLQKAEQLAREHGVSITTVVSRLEEFVIEDQAWEGIVAVYCQMEPSLRRRVHRACVAGLAPGGVFILEAFTPKQLAFRTGGPQRRELLMNLDELKEDLKGLQFKIAREVVCDRKEGLLHTGEASVVQIMAIKSSTAAGTMTTSM